MSVDHGEKSNERMEHYGNNSRSSVLKRFFFKECFLFWKEKTFFFFKGFVLYQFFFQNSLKIHIAV